MRSRAAATISASSTPPSRAASHARGRPTVILAKTKKGYGMGDAGESRMTTHQQKKLDVDALLAVPRPLRAAAVRRRRWPQLRFYKPADDSREMRYLRARRAALGGYLPARRDACAARRRARADRATRSFALRGRRQGDVDDDGGRAPASAIC